MARRQKGSVWRRVGEESSLLVLAALFTAVVWYLARENVRNEYTIEDVVVNLPAETDNQSYKVELIDKTIPVHLYCSERAYRELRQRLPVAGVTFVRGDSSSGDQRGIDRQLFNDRLVYPSGVAQHVVEEKMKLPRGRVLKVSSYTIKIDEPMTPDAELAAFGVGVQIVQQPDRQITATLPTDSIGKTDTGELARIRPDPLTPEDLGLTEADLDSRMGKEFKVPLTFDEWRAEKNADGEFYPGRKSIKLPEDAHVVVRLYRDGEAELSNRLVYGVPPQWFERYELRLVEAADLGVSGEGGREMTFTGTIVGTKSDLAALRAKPREWNWQIVVSDEADKLLDELDEGRTSVPIPVKFALMLREGFQNRGLRFRPTDRQKGEVVLKVSRREP
jgi:hypothetical protein